MRTEETIAAELAAARQEYHERHDTLTLAEAAEYSARIKALTAELSDLLSEGAEPCPACGSRPIGSRKGEISGLPIYAVICPACPSETLMQSETSELVRHRRAIGASPEQAVDRWNDGIYDVASRRR